MPSTRWNSQARPCRESKPRLSANSMIESREVVKKVLGALQPQPVLATVRRRAGGLLEGPAEVIGRKADNAGHRRERNMRAIRHRHQTPPSYR